MNPVVEKIQQALAEFVAKKEALVEELRQEFPKMFVDIFAANPAIRSFGWTQYTPYYCDGDSCSFGVNNETDSLYINGQRFDDDYEEDEDENTPGSGIKLDWRMQYVKDRSDSSTDEYMVQLRDMYPDGLSWDVYDAVKEISSILSSVPDEFYEDLFGDHTKVTVNADGTTETDDYEHD